VEVQLCSNFHSDRAINLEFVIVAEIQMLFFLVLAFLVLNYYLVPVVMRRELDFVIEFVHFYSMG
jgi:hypothetical protein